MLLICACGGSPKAVTTAPDELDPAIREASDYLNGRVESGSKAVFLNITSNYPDLSEYILSILSENAVNDGVFSVVDRQQLDAIRAELNFQWSGEVSDASAQEIGQMLGAQTIVSGTVSKIGSLYRLQVKAIAVQSAAVQGQWSKNIPDGATIAALTQTTGSTTTTASTGASRTGTAATASGTTSGTAAAATPAAPAAPAAPAYKVGDTGPAGGLIFYDKGNSTGGWRYLEAAPAEVSSRTLQWKTGGGAISNYKNVLERGIGRGLSNTKEIMEEANRTGGGFGWAAQACDAYELNGFDDWFLPSQDELNYMYGNLHLKGLGDFRNESYWASTTWDNSNGWSCSINFADGQVSGVGGNNSHNTSWCRVRAARRF